jgi:transcriptional regulator with XRE-family HTH domain
MEDHFGTQLRALRRERRMTLSQLGRAAGVSQSRLSRLECGGVTAKPDALRTILKALGAEDRVAEFAAMPNEPRPVARDPLIESPLGNRLRAMRERRGLNQGELARSAKVTPSCVSMLERGCLLTTPGRLHAILAALGATDHAAEFDRLAIKERRVIKFTLHAGMPQATTHMLRRLRDLDRSNGLTVKVSEAISRVLDQCAPT